MAGQMWFGTKGYMQWIPCARSGMDFGTKKWNNSSIFLNGGGIQRASTAGHMEYSPSWEMVSGDDARKIRDYYEGVYGNGLIYFIDPMAKNVLPQAWATPWLGTQDGPYLTGTRPTVGTVAANTLLYPAASAIYNGVTGAKSLYIPVPPGQNFYFGWHGTGTGTVRLTPDSGSVVNASTGLAVTSTTRTNVVCTNPGGVTLQLTAATTMNIAGMMGYIGTSAPSTGGFQSGQGHSGCRFDPDSFDMTGYSAPSALDKVSVSAVLREVGSWL